jgi:hypothetical protein
VTPANPRCVATIHAINCAWAVAAALVVGAAGVHDRAKLGKKIMLYSAGWATFWAGKWCLDYATILLTKDAQTMAAGALVITGVTGPIFALTGYILRKYLEEGTESQRIIANTPLNETKE